MKLSEQLQAERTFVEHSLGDSVICQNCNATLQTYADACTAGLCVACPGFLAIEQAKKEFADMRRHGIEPDLGPRNGAFHKRVMRAEPIPNTKSGHVLDLECGHRVHSFGSLEHANGVVLCTQCRDKEAYAANTAQ